MSTLREQLDVKCPYHYLIHHAERYFTRRRGPTAGTFSLEVDMSNVGLPAKVRARHDVQMCYKMSKGADGQDIIDLTWDPDDRFVPRFTGTLSSKRLEDGKSCVTLEGKYDPPLGPIGAVFDAVVGRRIAATTANALLQDIKQFIESDYQMALSTTLASSPKE